METTKVYLDMLPVNLNQGLLVDNCTEPMQIYGAYNSDKKVWVVQEGFRASEVSLPKSIESFAYIGKAGHFTVGYWDFNTYSEVNI